MRDNSVVIPQNGNRSLQVEDYDYDTVTFNRAQPPPPPPYTPYEIPTVSGGVRLPETRTVVIQPPPLKSGPIYYTCPACAKSIVTRVEYFNTKKTHMTAGFICGFTFWCMMCCLAAIPYITSTFKKAVHYCPNCKTCLGSYSRV